MLVLSRKAREQIQIGEEVIVTILQVKGQSVRIGIEAPRNVRVLRSELPKYDAASEDKTEHDATETSVEVATPRASRTVMRRNHPNDQQCKSSPPLANRLDARRSPGSNSVSPLRSSQRMELTMLRFDSAAKSTAF